MLVGWAERRHAACALEAAAERRQSGGRAAAERRQSGGRAVAERRQSGSSSSALRRVCLRPSLLSAASMPCLPA